MAAAIFDLTVSSCAAAFWEAKAKAPMPATMRTFLMRLPQDMVGYE
jgi:hypothetical protein